MPDTDRTRRQQWRITAQRTVAASAKMRRVVACGVRPDDARAVWLTRLT
jgi:hypothetical protein